MSIHRSDRFKDAQLVAVVTSVNCHEDNFSYTVGARYYTAIDQTTKAVPGAGTILVEGFSDIVDDWVTIGNLDATDVLDEFLVVKEISAVRGTPTGITVAVAYALCVIGRRV